MIDCKELVGKVIRTITIYEELRTGPEIQIEFTDDTTFFACLKTSTTLEAKCLQDSGGEPQLIKDYTAS